MTYRIVLSPSARADIARVGRWWRQNRPLNPGLFRRELGEARELLTSSPEIGLLVGRRGARRVVLERTQYALYYRVNRSTRTILVLTIWYMARGTHPRL